MGVLDKIKKATRYLFDENETSQTLANNSITPIEFDLRRGNLTAHEIAGGNVIKLVAKPNSIRAYWNTTRDRSTAMILDDLNRGVKVMQQNKYGNLMTYRNIYLWTEGELQETDYDPFLKLEIAGISKEVDFLLGTQSQVEIMAKQWERIAESLQDFGEKLASIKEETIKTSENTQKQLLASGRISQEAVTNLKVDLSNRARKLLAPYIVSEKEYILGSVKAKQFVFNGLPVYVACQSFMNTQDSTAKITADREIEVGISIQCAFFANNGYRINGGGSGWINCPSYNFASGSYGIAEEATQMIPIDSNKIKGQTIISYYKNHGGQWISTASCTGLAIPKDISINVGLMNFPVENGGLPDGNEYGAIFQIYTVEGSYNGNNVTLTISCDIEKEYGELITEIPELPEIQQPEPEPQKENIKKIILTMERTATTTDNAIGATALKFLDTENVLFEATPNISGNTGTLTFIHNDYYFTGDFTLNIGDKGAEYNKNLIFTDAENKSWISETVAENQKIQMIIDFSNLSNSNSTIGAPNIISGIQLLNGKAILGKEGQENLESWFQKANLLIIGTNDKIIVNRNYKFANIGMQLEAQLPDGTIVPPPPTPPAPDPTQPLPSLESIPSKITISNTGYGSPIIWLATDRATFEANGGVPRKANDGLLIVIGSLGYNKGYYANSTERNSVTAVAIPQRILRKLQLDNIVGSMTTMNNTGISHGTYGGMADGTNYIVSYNGGYGYLWDSMTVADEDATIENALEYIYNNAKQPLKEVFNDEAKWQEFKENMFLIKMSNGSSNSNDTASAGAILGKNGSGYGLKVRDFDLQVIYSKPTTLYWKFRNNNYANSYQQRDVRVVTGMKITKGTEVIDIPDTPINKTGIEAGIYTIEITNP